MTDTELRELIEQIIATQYEADSYSDDFPTRATPMPPATTGDIGALNRYLNGRGLALPPSFAQLLKIHNGIRDFIPSMELSIRSAQEIQDSSESDLVWKHISPAHRFVFASGDTTSFVGFLPESMNERGEMGVLMVNEAGETTEYDDFQEFLTDQLDYYTDVLEAERADRESLADD